jgi:hypothetical protein
VKDLKTWVAKRTSWREWGHKVEVDGHAYLHENIALGLFRERQQLVQKLAKERSRRKTAEARARGVDACPADRISAALDAAGCERLREWAAIGPVQRAAVEAFADALTLGVLEVSRG